MRIENYDNRSVNLSKLREEGRSDWFIAGAMDGIRGENVRRPHPPILQVRELAGGKIEMWGNTYQYREHLKRIGGMWKPSSKTWIFPASALKELRSDPELNEFEDLWSGIPDDEAEYLKSALVEYSAGYVWGQEKAIRMPIGKVSGP